MVSIGARCIGGEAAHVAVAGRSPLTQRQREVPGSCRAGMEGMWCWWLAWCTVPPCMHIVGYHACMHKYCRSARSGSLGKGVDGSRVAV